MSFEHRALNKTVGCDVVLWWYIFPEQFNVKAQQTLFPTWLSVVTWLCLCRNCGCWGPPSCQCDHVQNCEGAVVKPFVWKNMKLACISVNGPFMINLSYNEWSIASIFNWITARLENPWKPITTCLCEDLEQVVLNSTSVGRWHVLFLQNLGLGVRKPPKMKTLASPCSQNDRKAIDFCCYSRVCAEESWVLHKSVQ